MYKLSKIEIHNFRAFKGQNPIDFIDQSTGMPYNFICIYGPNGSGKTSLSDAFEWLATGKLHRISSEMQVQGKTYEGAILTNIEDYNNDKRAHVNACFVDSDLNTINLSRSISLRKNSVNDYLSGTFSGSGLTPAQILPYSRVSGFVSAEKPEQRFSSWAGFIDSEDQSFSLLINTFRMRSKIKVMLDNLENELETVVGEVKRCNLDTEIISNLNNSIRSFNEEFYEILPDENSLDFIQQDEKGVFLIPSLNLIRSIQIRTTSIYEKICTKELVYKDLVDNYSKYNKAYNDLSCNYEMNKKYHDTINKILLKNEYEALIGNINSLSNAILVMLNENVCSLIEQIKSDEIQKENFKIAQVSWRQQIIQIEKDTMDLETANPNLTYHYAVEQQSILQSCLTNLDQIDLAIQSNDYDIASTYMTQIPQNFYHDILDKINELSECNNEMQSINSQLKQVSIKIKEAENSCNNIVISIEQIRSHIINEHMNVCPVCQSEFMSTELLLARIKDEFCSKDLAEARVEYSAKELILKGLLDSFQKILQTWISTKQIICKKLGEDLFDLNKQIELTLIKTTEYNHKLQIIEEKRKIIKEQLNSIIDFKYELTLETYDIFIKEVYQILDKSHSEKKTILNQLQTLNGKIYNNKVDVFDKPKDDLQDDLQQLETLLYLLPVQSEKFSALKLLIQEYISQCRILLANRGSYIDLSDINPSELQTYKSKKSELEQQQIELKSVVDNYQGLYEKVQLTREITIEQIRQLVIDEQKRKSILDNKIFPALINILSYETDLLTYQKQYSTLIQKADELKARELDTKKTFDNIDNLYNAMCDLQQKRVDQAFASEMVSRLYRILEPNKDFPKLSFKIDFNNSERPELYIIAHEKEDDKMVLPELIFSTAQLNTISLCLFLSNVITNTHLESKTIILDDPISSFDDINTVAFADLLRILCVQNDWQIIFTTHDEKLFRLLQVKLSPEYHKSLFMQFREKAKMVDII